MNRENHPSLKRKYIMKTKFICGNRGHFCKTISKLFNQITFQIQDTQIIVFEICFFRKLRMYLAHQAIHIGLD